MPNHLTVDAINSTLSVASVRSIADDPELMEQMGRSGSFVEVARTLLGLGDDEIAYLEAIPPVLQEAARAAVAEAVSAGKAVQVQYSPGYDFEIRLWDYGRAVSLHLSGPYPPDFARDRYLGTTTTSD